MFRNMSGEERVSSGKSSPSRRRQAVPSPGLDGQESPWIGLLSLVSRPALSFLQRYLPMRPRTPSRSDDRTKNSFVDEEAEFLRQLDDMVPLTQHAAPHLTCLRCRYDRAAGPLQPGGGSTVPWLTAESLREIGIKSAEDMDLNLCHENHLGSSAKTLLGHVWLSSGNSQEAKPAGPRDRATEAASPSVNGSTWLGSFWGCQESPQKGLLSGLSWADEGTHIGPFCPQQPKSETKVPSAQTAALFVQNDGWMLGENTGPAGHTDANNRGPQTVQNGEGSTLDHRLSITNRLSSSDALLTPDQDNGYSSLEEEHFHMFRLYVAKAISADPPPEAATCAAVRTEAMRDCPVDSPSGTVDEKNQGEREGLSAEELLSPRCQNKAIAFIMGCPCSDEESSQSDDESSGDEDDDGFDSEGLSDPDSSDEDDESSDSEADSEAERLWSSLCHSEDPYNPQNFTARLHTSSTLPKTIPTSTPPSSTQSTPASSPDFTPLPRSSPPSGSDSWDDSTSSSEVDEAESLRLWSSFSCSSDPYSPLNFQAPLRTRGAVEPEPRARTKKASQTPLRSLRRAPAPPTEYKKEEAEERLDSGFCEASTSATKKVRFCDHVEEFFASCGEEEEDRHSPWEELARDRCRFLRRCQEVEQSIAYCLQPQHRSLVYRRLAVVQIQDASP